jgi:hypothetical protein
MKYALLTALLTLSVSAFSQSGERPRVGENQNDVSANIVGVGCPDDPRVCACLKSGDCKGLETPARPAGSESSSSGATKR